MDRIVLVRHGQARFGITTLVDRPGAVDKSDDGPARV
jgi:hypothetical protein